RRSLIHTMGRWAERDPIGTGDGMDLYAFVNTDPTSRLDSYGTLQVFPLNNSLPTTCNGTDIWQTWHFHVSHPRLTRGYFIQELEASCGMGNCGVTQNCPGLPPEPQLVVYEAFPVDPDSQPGGGGANDTGRIYAPKGGTCASMSFVGRIRYFDI